MMKKVISIALIIMMLLICLPCFTSTASAETTPQIGIGHYIQFGKYNNEPILWRVININEDGSYMLFSEEVLCTKPFDAAESGYWGSNYDNTATDIGRQKFGSNNWEKSNLREWLNSNQKVVTYSTQPPTSMAVSISEKEYASESGFLYNFTNEECNLIQPVTHKSLLDSKDVDEYTKGIEEHKNVYLVDNILQNYETAFYKDITDKVYLLDVYELYEYVYKRNFDYRKRPTTILEASDLIAKYYNNNTFWRYWLRTPLTDDNTISDATYNVRDISAEMNYDQYDCYYMKASNGYGGVAPSINLKSNISVSNGDGSKENPYTISVSSEQSQQIKIGDYIQIGEYYDEPIIWRCVDIDENGPLMLSDKILCLKAFDASGLHNGIQIDKGSNSWEYSNIRAWLNSTSSAGNVQWACGNPPINDNLDVGTVFYGHFPYAEEKGFLADGNFTEDERKLIKPVSQKSILSKDDKSIADGVSTYCIRNDSQSTIQNYEASFRYVTDNIFLLDISQYNKIYDNSSILGEKYYIGKLSDKTKAQIPNNAFVPENLDFHSLMRSPFTEYGYVMVSDYNNYIGGGVPSWSYGIRPAFYLNETTGILNNGNGSIGDPYTISIASNPISFVNEVQISDSIDISKPDSYLEFFGDIKSNYKIKGIKLDFTSEYIEDNGYDILHKSHSLVFNNEGDSYEYSLANLIGEINTNTVYGGILGTDIWATKLFDSCGQYKLNISVILDGYSQESVPIVQNKPIDVEGNVVKYKIRIPSPINAYSYEHGVIPLDKVNYYEFEIMFPKSDVKNLNSTAKLCYLDDLINSGVVSINGDRAYNVSEFIPSGLDQKNYAEYYNNEVCHLLDYYLYFKSGDTFNKYDSKFIRTEEIISPDEIENKQATKLQEIEQEYINSVDKKLYGMVKNYTEEQMLTITDERVLAAYKAAKKVKTIYNEVTGKKYNFIKEILPGGYNSEEFKILKEALYNSTEYIETVYNNSTNSNNQYPSLFEIKQLNGFAGYKASYFSSINHDNIKRIFNTYIVFYTWAIANSGNACYKFVDPEVLLTPKDELTKAIVKVQCPVTVDFYYNNNLIATINDTSLTYQENEYGFFYSYYANGELVKKAYLYNENVKSVIRGTGAGSMDITIDKKDETGLFKPTFFYDKIPVSSMSIFDAGEIATTDSINCDENGDGIFDTKISAHIVKLPTSAELDNTSLKLMLGTTKQMSYTISPQDTLTIDGNSWWSNDSFIASVDNKGVVSANHIGKTEIVFYAGNGIIRTCIIEVVEMIEPPQITISDYNRQITNQDITVFVTVDHGHLNVDHYTFTENGSYEFIATDEAGNVSKKTVEVTNIDKTAPEITIGDYIKTPTNQDVILTATTNEGVLNAGSHTFTENGSFTFTATDAAGNTSRKEIVITNIDKVAPVTTLNINDFDVLPIETVLEFSSTDPNSNEPVAISAKLILGNQETEIPSEYKPTAGVYQLKLTAIDIAGNVTEKCVSFVIYDPNGGFVTGGGWINSPIGAYAVDPTLSGKASFGFVSEYKKGATIPTGQTEFQFKVGGLNFQSTSYDWLVVAGSRAQYKGKGTINGQGEYGFMLTAIDGDLKTTDKNDRFRIKIWDIKTGAIIYDNQINTDDTADLSGQSTVLGGGSIVIHK